MSEQVTIDFLVTGNLSSLLGQVGTLNKELLQTAGSVNMLDRSMANMNMQAANRQFAQTLTMSNQFDARMVTLASHTDTFGKSLQNASLSGRKYFQESLMYIRRQRAEIHALATEQIRLQNSLVQPMGRTTSGRMMTNVFTPTGLADDVATRTRVANKSWEIFNRTAQEGANKMVNWGKNTQWAGRQLMVGFTVPLAIMGGLAAKTFKDLDTELVRLQKVYGSGLTFGADFAKQSAIVRESAMDMVKEMAGAYGKAGSETAALMADLAATGLEGSDLDQMTRNTTRLAVLGEVDRQEAMKATISLQTAFGLSTAETADAVNFLNAVENQTSTSLQDLVEGIPRAGTVVKALGGDVQDLALYMTAFREGGISAAEGANALKSGLSSIIAPPQAAIDFMKEMGINLPKLVTQNQGDLTGTIMAFREELNGLDDLARQQVITKLFGKYQFARMNALFNNLGAQGSQTVKVLELAGYSVEELGQIADQEVKAITESASGKWQIAWAKFQATIAQAGETILMWGTKALGILNKVFGFIEDHDWAMNIVKYGGLALAVIGPIIMTMGLLGNMIGMLAKGGLRLINTFKAMKSGGGIAKSFELITAESVAADAAMDKMTASMYDQKTATAVLTEAITQLGQAYSGMQMVQDQSMTTANAMGGSRNLATGASGFARGHIIPEAIPEDYRAQIVSSFGLQGAEANAIMAGTHGLNMGRFGYTNVSAETNARAGNAMQFFAGTKQGTLTDAEMNAAINADKFFEHMRAGLTEVGVQQEKIDQWEMDANKRIAAARKGQMSAELALIETMAEITQMTTMNQRSVKSNIIKRGSDFDSVSRDRAAGILTGEQGLTGSINQKDQEMAAQIAGVDMAATQDLTASKVQLNNALDRAKVAADAQGTAMIITAEETAGLAAAQQMLENKTKATVASYEYLSVGNKRYLVALSSSGAVLSAASMDASGAYKKVATNSTRILGSIETELKARRDLTIKMEQNAAALARDTLVTGAATTARGATTAAARGGIMGNVASKFTSGRLPMAANSAAMMLPMMGTMATPSGSVAGGLSQGAMMGSMAGMMIPGPWGMAIGAGVGLAAAGIGEIFHSIKAESDRRAAEAAAEWEAQFGAIDISSDLAKQLKMPLDTFKMPQIDLSGFGQAIETASAKYSAAVKEGMKDQIAQVKTMSEGGAMEYGQRMFTNLVAGGAETNDAMKLVREVLEQAGQGIAGFKLSAQLDVNLNEKDAEKQVKLSMERIAMQGAMSFNDVIAKTSVRSDALNEAASQSASAYMNGLQEALDTGAIKPEKYFSATLKGVEDIRGAMNKQFENSSFMQTVKTIPGGLALLRKQTGLTGNSIKELQASFNDLTGTQQADFFTQFASGRNITANWTAEQNSAMIQLGKTIYSGGQAQAEYLKTVRENNAEIAGLADRYMELNRTESIERATLMALRTARQQYNRELRTSAMSADFAKLASGYMNDSMQMQKININKLERQQSREMDRLQESESNRLDNMQEAESDRLDALQESESSRLEAMQNAAEKRERLMQKEIDQVARSYDKEIAQIQRTEDKRQEAFNKEQELFQKRQEMRNLEISYNEAVAGGDLFEAARLRMDIAATRKQNQAESAEERRQNRVEKRIKQIEKEKNAKVRAMEKALRQEQRANERAIESAQKASEAKIEAAQDASNAMIEAAQKASEKTIAAAEKANKQEVKSANEKNKKIADMEKTSAANSARLFNLLVNGRIRKFNEEARDLGIKARERSALMSNFVAKEFGKLPDKLYNSVAKAIAGGNWDLLQKLMKGKIEGMSTSELADMAKWQMRYDAGGSPGAAAQHRATGGFISGPGGSMSDSIPAMLSDGEYVVRAQQVAKYGKQFFDKINDGHDVGHPAPDGRSLGMAMGGIVWPVIKSGILKPAGEKISQMMGALKSGPRADSFGAPSSAGSGNIIMWDGEPVDSLTAAQLKLAGQFLGSRYTVYQGSYQPATSYSGTTHTDGGVIDTQGSGVYSRAVIDLQKAGFAAWYRGPGAPGSASRYPAHVHAISLLNRNLDPNAAYQKMHYLNMSGDGLGNPYYGPHVAPINGLKNRLPGLRQGAAFVKYDNTLANLHRGESVLTAPMTRNLKENVASGGGAQYNVNVEVINPAQEIDVTRAVVKALEAREMKHGRNRVIR